MIRDRLAFCLHEIVLSDGRRLGETLERDAWVVEELLVPVFARDSDGLPLHRLVYYEAGRGSWKTGGCAAVALAEVVLADEPTDVVVAAADRDQAAIVIENLDGYIARNPALEGVVYARGNERIVSETGSRVRVISSDAPTAWGLGGTHQRFRVVCEELTVWRDEQLWSALASATGKVADTQTIVLSNAGFDADRSWQWRVREAARTEPWGHLYSPAGIVASWVSPAWVEMQQSLLPPPAFARVILNRWSSGAGDFVTAGQWAGCVDAGLRPARGGRGRFTGHVFVAGLDLGLTKDRTALAVVHREAGRVVLDELDVWGGSRSEPVSISAIERAVVDVASRFSPLRVVCDPWQLRGSAERLRAAGIRVEEFTFGQSSVQRLSATLFHAVTSGQLRVFPDEGLDREILGLVVRETGAGWRIDHRAGGFSDRAVALALATHEALARPERPPPSLIPPVPERIWSEEGWRYSGSLTDDLLRREM